MVFLIAVDIRFHLLQYSMSEKAKGFLHGFDLFSYQPVFRIRGQSEVSSLCGGATSLLVMGFFVYLFVVEMIGIISLDKISASSTTLHNSLTQHSVSDLTVAIGIRDLPLEQFEAYFQIKASLEIVNGNTTTSEDVKLVDCHPSMWRDSEGEEMTELFEKYGIGEMLCLDPDAKIELKGLRREKQMQMLKVKINKCVQDEGDEEEGDEDDEEEEKCFPAEEVGNFMAQFLSENRYFIADFYYLNTGFNINEGEPEVKYIEDKVWLTFSEGHSSEAFVELGSYEISTDVSFWPTQQEEFIQGNYLVNYNVASFTSELSDLVEIQISLAAEEKFIERQYGKIDDRLSYIGGLFEIVIITLSFFLNSYNLYRYELMVSEKTYTDTSGAKPQEKDFHFLTYMKYTLHQWAGILCCCSPEWADCQKITEAREEANEQLDVEQLLRRMNHHEDCVSLSKEEKALFMKNPNTIRQHRKRRKYLQYYDQAVKDELPMTMKETKEKERRQDKSIEITDLASMENMEPSPSKASLEMMVQSGKVANEYEELSKEEQEVEEEMLKSYLLMEEESKEAVMEDIPVKILQRLRSRQAKVGKDEMNHSKVKRTKSYL